MVTVKQITVKAINLNEEEQKKYDEIESKFVGPDGSPLTVLEETKLPNVYVVRAKTFIQSRGKANQLYIVGITDTVIEIEGGYGQLYPIETQLNKNIALVNTSPFINLALTPTFEVQCGNNPIEQFEVGEPIAYLVVTPTPDAIELVKEDKEVDIQAYKAQTESEAAATENNMEAEPVDDTLADEEPSEEAKTIDFNGAKKSK